MVSRSEGRLFGQIVKKEAMATAVKVESGLKKVISFAGMKVKSKIAAYLPEDSAVNIRTDNFNQLEPEIEREIVETGNVDKSKLYAQESVETSITNESENSTGTFNGIGSEELSMDCLTCANLIGCDFRGKMSAKLEGSSQNVVPCNLANHRDLQIKKQVKQ